jgi:hypothetical protein
MTPQEVLTEVDRHAREYMDYDFGLPLHNEDATAKMLAVVEEAIRSAIAAERERCAKVIEGFKTASPGGCESYWGESLAAMIRKGAP